MDTSPEPPGMRNRGGSGLGGDWVGHGHADATSLKPIFGAHSERLDGTTRPVSRLQRSVRATGGTILLAVAVLGSAGAAVGLRDALFPAVGGAMTLSVWQNPGRDAPTTPPATTTSTTSTTTTTAVEPPEASTLPDDDHDDDNDDVDGAHGDADDDLEIDDDEREVDIDDNLGGDDLDDDELEDGEDLDDDEVDDDDDLETDGDG